LADLCWGGTLDQPLLLCATSGSTGEPFYFPRSEQLAIQYAETLCRFITQGRRRQGTTTLVIVAFGMGVWIAGTFTVRALELVQLQIPGVSVLPVGVNQNEIMNALVRLSPNFDQTVLVGYPPFIRDVLVGASSAGVDLPSLNLRLGFAAESFDESFRSFVCRVAGIAQPERDTFNIYGSADLGAMAAETPTSIVFRQQILAHSPLAAAVFGEVGRTPTLAQFEPSHILFEDLDGEIAITGDSALPLVRYLIGDRGGVVSYTELTERCQRFGVDLRAECQARNLDPDTRPFVYVYERVDLAASLFGILVYPEYIKRGLEHLVHNHLASGRFSMETVYTETQQQSLRIHVERTSDGATLNASEVAEQVTGSLRAQSSEFRELSTHLDESVLIQVTLWPQGAPPYFSSGGKQPWVIPKDKVAANRDPSDS